MLGSVIIIVFVLNIHSSFFVGCFQIEPCFTRVADNTDVPTKMHLKYQTLVSLGQILSLFRVSCVLIRYFLI